MDDFGTGYSSLSYLTRFPVKKIKIDRSFIDTLGTSPQTRAIVSSIVGLGQSLNVTITAEGVETEGQAAMLRKWGCDQVQGFYYGKPEADVPESEEVDRQTPPRRLALAASVAAGAVVLGACPSCSGTRARLCRRWRGPDRWPSGLPEAST